MKRWAMTLGLMLGAISLAAGPVRSLVPCDFKGVSAGDKMSREQLMQRLGISKFKMDPPTPSFDAIEKYGVTSAAEMQDDNLGPYCREDYCNIPFGITVGDDNIPVKVFVSLRNEEVTEIEVFFNSFFWNDVFTIIERKYGSAWNIERTITGVIDYSTKKVDQLEQIIAMHKLGGYNSRTQDTCSLTATNIDIIFRHHDRLGTLHAIFVIKRESKNF